MRTSVVAALSCAVGVAIGVVAAVTVANADDPVDSSDATVQKPVDCTDVIGEDVLQTLAWSDASARAEERVGRCEWLGDQGNITVGTVVASLSEKCDEASSRESFQASVAWLADPAVEKGCVVAPEGGIGLYEVLTEQGGEVVQVRVSLLEERPVDDVRAALRLLVAAAPQTAG